MSTAVLAATVTVSKPEKPDTLETLFPPRRIPVPVSWPHLLANVPDSIKTPALRKKISEAERVLAAGLRVVEANSTVTRDANRRAAERAYSTDPSQENLTRLTETTALAGLAVCDAAQKQAYSGMQLSWQKLVAPLVVEVFPKLIQHLEGKREEVKLVAERTSQAYGTASDAARLPAMILDKAIEILQQEITRATAYNSGGRDAEHGTQHDLHAVPEPLLILAR
ncbi:MAG TPA: hypothetical protein VHI52_01105 [Verrucomicrobiae bacterium]|nr:hypothetical protein [Verrucomicrobiae bacterium]